MQSCVVGRSLLAGYLVVMSAGVAMLEGIQKILNPSPCSESPWVNYTVLALSLVFEGRGDLSSSAGMSTVRG